MGVDRDIHLLLQSWHISSTFIMLFLRLDLKRFLYDLCILMLICIFLITRKTERTKQSNNVLKKLKYMQFFPRFLGRSILYSSYVSIFTKKLQIQLFPVLMKELTFQNILIKNILIYTYCPIILLGGVFYF